MSVDKESSLLEDLQRCRRLVAALRGQVLAPTRKQEVMKQLVVVVKENHQQNQTRWSTGNPFPSPREQYLRNKQAARIKVIQRRWRRSAWTNLLTNSQGLSLFRPTYRRIDVVAQASAAEAYPGTGQDGAEVENQTRLILNCPMPSSIFPNQDFVRAFILAGVPRFRKSALTIQRTYRGHFVRKHRIDITTYIAGFVPKLDRLRSDREGYHLKCEDLQQELRQVQLDIEVIRDKILEEEKAMTLRARTKPIGARDSHVVHDDAAELVECYKNEMADLEELAVQLGKELQELREKEPVVHVAATMIQALYKGVQYRMGRMRERQRQRQVYTRMLQSKERCYDRMHAACMIRNQKLWDESARIIATLYHIQRAKNQQEYVRRDHGARRISRLYQDIQIRTAAKQSLQWKKAKLQAKEIVKRKHRDQLQFIWSGWVGWVQQEAQRRQRIAERVDAGFAKWCDTKARWFLFAYRKRIAKRKHLECEITTNLNDRVVQHIRAAIPTDNTEPSALEISSRFFLLIRNDIWTWHEPDKQLYFLARRYKLPLDSFPLKQIHQWLSEEAPSFVDLYAPLLTQTLLVLKQLSKYFTLQSHILLQTKRVREVFEAHMVVREYLALLYAAVSVRLSPSTTFSSQQRQRAVEILREKDRIEYLPDAKDNELESGVQRNTFTSFHCFWNHHLCDRCLAMRPDKHQASRQCRICGHHKYEANTVARDLRLESLEKDGGLSAAPFGTPTRIMWASAAERCDFMILNAFLHALAPVDHENRRTQSLDTLWKLALKNAYEPVAVLYNRLPTGSLNDLLNASQEELHAWTIGYCPSGVDEQLSLFITVMKDEWTQVDAQLTFEAQAAAKLSWQQEQMGERQSGNINNVMVKRKKNKRLVQPNGRLKPLVGATHS